MKLGRDKSGKIFAYLFWILVGIALGIWITLTFIK